MIALALLAMCGVYIAAFALAGVKSRTWSQRIFWWCLLIAPVALVTWDMPIGYYRFKALCEREGGVRIIDGFLPKARVLRLDVAGMMRSGSAALLLDYPSLVAIEAGDKKYQYASPPAYARYERRPAGTSAPNTLPHELLVSRLIDRVEERNGRSFTIERGPSEADYVLREEYSEQPIRTSVNRYTLEHSDGRLVGTSTRISYSWTNAASTLLGRTSVDDCGGPVDGYVPLLELITEPKTGR